MPDLPGPLADRFVCLMGPAALLLHWFAWLFRRGLFCRCGQAFKGYRPRTRPPSACRGKRKPAWVGLEVLRLAALTGHGCRSVALLFNRLHSARRKMSVSKSYVAYTVRRHRYEIELLRRFIKHRRPRPVPSNHIWALDMTGKGDTQGDVHSILGIEDHGTRALLALEVLERRNAWTLLGHLFLAIGRFGKPRAIRTDNDSVFRRALFRLVCALANIRQQFTARRAALG